MTSGLTRGGSQLVGQVGSKSCFGSIQLWRSNRLTKRNGLRKIDSWGERKLWRRILAAAV
jgi:hypothetical protein